MIHRVQVVSSLLKKGHVNLVSLYYLNKIQNTELDKDRNYFSPINLTKLINWLRRNLRLMSYLGKQLKSDKLFTAVS